MGIGPAATDEENCGMGRSAVGGSTSLWRTKKPEMGEGSNRQRRGSMQKPSEMSGFFSRATERDASFPESELESCHGPASLEQRQDSVELEAK